jgi:uncharacterized protein
MAARTSNLKTIHEFLSQNRIAMVGVSRNPTELSSKLFEELSSRGYEMFPVNPGVAEILGKPCFSRVQQIQPPVKAVLLMTSPQVTESVVNDCIEAGVEYIWMYRATGAGAVSEKAIELCRARGILVVPGECPFMFLPEADFIHRLHGMFRKITGSYPRPTAA